MENVMFGEKRVVCKKYSYVLVASTFSMQQIRAREESHTIET
jgi:hypothetical protein